MNQGAIRKSAFAGTWYPGRSSALRTSVEQFLGDASSVPPDGDVVALVSPHAGHVYSGHVAAHAYKTVQKAKYDAVIITGPSHRVAFRGVSVFAGEGFETPLGVVQVETDLANRISKEGTCVFAGMEEHALEHSIEIQLPFLQIALEGISFVPILMGDQDSKTCSDLARAIVRASEGKKILVIASSDLSHYYPYDKAVKMDASILKNIEKMSPEGLFDDIRNHAGEACGAGPIAVSMMVARELGADTAKVLKYADSGDITGDKNGVVGYAAAVFYRKAH